MRLLADDIVFYEAPITLGRSRGWCQEYRLHIDWIESEDGGDDWPCVRHITLTDCPADKEHDLLSAPEGSPARTMGAWIKKAIENDPSFIDFAYRETGHETPAPHITAALERMEYRREAAE
jgi:hypothetical protein